MTQAEWHPYPEETPPTVGDYFLTIDTYAGRLVLIASWLGTQFNLFVDSGAGCRGIVAWIPITKPEPYMEDEDESAQQS